MKWVAFALVLLGVKLYRSAEDDTQHMIAALVVVAGAVVMFFSVS